MYVEKSIVFVRRSGGWKADDAWSCTSASEATKLANWLRHLGLRNVETMTFEQHEALPTDVGQ